MLEAVTSRWWLLLVRGIAAILFAFAAMIWPQITLPVLTLLFGIYALVDGVFAIAAATSPVAGSRAWAFLIEGLVGLVVAFFVFTQPAISIVAFVYAVGLWSVFTGIIEIVAGLQLRDVITNEWLYVLAGIVSIVFGVLVVRYPAAGALAIVWLFATYAFAFGILQVALSYRLHRLHTAMQHPSAPIGASR